MDTNQYLEIFIDESKENLQHMNGILLELEQDPDNLSHLGEIFRVAHTLKGMSGTMGYTKLMGLTHEMESLMDLVRNGTLPVTPEIIDVLFECFDSLDVYVDNLERTGLEGDLDTSELIKKLVRLSGTDAGEPAKKLDPNSDEGQKDLGFNIRIDDIEDIMGQAVEQGLTAHMIRVHLDEACLLKAARAFIVFNNLERLGEVLRSNPTAEDIEDERFENSFEVLYITKMAPEMLEAEIMNVSEVAKVEIHTLDIEAAGLDAAEDVEVDLDSVEEQEEKQKAERAEKSKTSKTVRVEISRLDNLMNLVSELIIVKTRLEDLGTGDSRIAEMHEAIEYLERITTNLHSAVMKVRMVPVERTFNRFPRLVRDLSKDLGKNIKLFMSGEQTEVDRTVIDEIGDPLIHLIRNSIDHGIEMPDERVKEGKEDSGFVALRAYPDGNTVVIEVEDDGKGIDPMVIKKISIKKNLVTKEEADQMSDKELINLLFRAGFSTAEKVTDVSGRGVGLDVVKSKIEAINGTVEVESILGQGSKFIIRLPLTLAIIDALMVRLGEERFAIPLNNIKEITSISSSRINMVQDQEVVLYRNNTLPILRMRDVLMVDAEPIEDEEMVVVIVRKGDLEAGLVVDSLIDQQEIVIKSLGKYLTGIKAIAGATILGNGSVALIVDPNQLI